MRSTRDSVRRILSALTLDIPDTSTTPPGTSTAFPDTSTTLPDTSTKQHHKRIQDLILSISLLGILEPGNKDTNKIILEERLNTLSTKIAHKYLYIINNIIKHYDAANYARIKEYLNDETYVINENDEILWAEFFHNTKLGLELLKKGLKYCDKSVPIKERIKLCQKNNEKYEIIGNIYKIVLPQYKISEAILKYASRYEKLPFKLCYDEIEALNKNPKHMINDHWFGWGISKKRPKPYNIVLVCALKIYQLKVQYKDNEVEYFRQLSNYVLRNRDKISRYISVFCKIFARCPSDAVIIILYSGNFKAATVISRDGEYTKAGRRKLFFPKNYSVKINHLSKEAITFILNHRVENMSEKLIRELKSLKQQGHNKTKKSSKDYSVIIKKQKSIINYLAKNQIASALFHLASLGNYIVIKYYLNAKDCYWFNSEYYQLDLKADKWLKLNADVRAKLAADAWAKLSDDEWAKLKADAQAKLPANEQKEVVDALKSKLNKLNLKNNKLLILDADELAKLTDDEWAKLKADARAKLTADAQEKVVAALKSKLNQLNLKNDKLLILDADELAKLTADAQKKLKAVYRSKLELKSKLKLKFIKWKKLTNEGYNAYLLALDFATVAGYKKAYGAPLRQSAQNKHIAKWLAAVTNAIKAIDQNDGSKLSRFSKAIQLGLLPINKKITDLYVKNDLQTQDDELTGKIKNLVRGLMPLYKHLINKYDSSECFWADEALQNKETSAFFKERRLSCAYNGNDEIKQLDEIKKLKDSISENFAKFSHWKDKRDQFNNILNTLALVEKIGYEILLMLINSSDDVIKNKARSILGPLNKAIKNVESSTIRMALIILYLKIKYQHYKEGYPKAFEQYIKTNKRLLNEDSQPDYYSGLRFNLYKILDKEDAAMLAGVTGNKNEKLTIEKYKYFSKNNRARLFASNLPGPIKKLSTLATCCLPGWVKCRGRGRGSCW